MTRWRTTTARQRNTLLTLAVLLVLMAVFLAVVVDDAALRALFVFVAAQAAFWAGVAVASRALSPA